MKLNAAAQYAQRGFNKQVLIFIAQETFDEIKKLAEKEERTIQVVLRRFLETHFNPKEKP